MVHVSKVVTDMLEQYYIDVAEDFCQLIIPYFSL